MPKEFKEKDWWLTANGDMAKIIQVFQLTSDEKGDDDSTRGKVDIYNIGGTTWGDRKFTSGFSESWLVKKVNKEDCPEYWL